MHCCQTNKPVKPCKFSFFQNESYEEDDCFVEENNVPKGIGGGMNFCASKVDTEYIMFLHSDFYVTENWDLECLREIKKHELPTWVFSHRVEPDIFRNGKSRPGTIIVPTDTFGAYFNDFNDSLFDEFTKEFIKLNDFTIPKTEGVSGLIKKEDWDKIGGNDPQFSPTSWEDKDLFLRMILENYKFVLTSKSVVWHFGARGSHRLEENNGKSSQRQIESENRNINNWLNKWKKMPVFNENGFIQKW